MSLMVSISGIRGVVGSTLTPETIVRYVSAYAEYCNRGRVVIGRDGRVTGAGIVSIATETLVQMGCDVVDLGICPTPTVALAVERMHAAGGIAVTASHNPMIWNGLKFFAPDGLFLDAEQNRKFWQIADAPSRAYKPWNEQGKVEHNQRFLDEHIDAVLAIPFIDRDALVKRRFRVVLDCVNSSGGIVVPKLLEKLGCDVVRMNCDVSGIFQHTPEPIPENLTGLSAEVAAKKADIGIAVDPDSDRLVLIREDGIPYSEEYTVATCVDFVLSKEIPGASAKPIAVVNLSTTRAVEDIVRSRGGALHRTPVGEINVAKKMRETGAVIGGEGSGGVIYPRVHTGRDALVGIALVLQKLLEFGGPLSQLKQSLPHYSIVKGKVQLGTINADSVLKRLADRHASAGTINTDDGLKIDFPTAWVHLRKSNTEPIIRIIAEAPTAEQAEQYVRRFTDEILGT